MTSEQRIGSEPPAAKAARVLVIDDIQLVHRVIEACLGGMDVENTFALSAFSAFETIANEVPDLIILDLALPEMDGWQILRRLRASEETAHVPILVVTAHGQSGTAGEVIKLGADAYLEKPFRRTELMDTVQRLLDGRGVVDPTPS